MSLKAFNWIQTGINLNFLENMLLFYCTNALKVQNLWSKNTFSYSFGQNCTQKLLVVFNLLQIMKVCKSWETKYAPMFLHLFFTVHTLQSSNLHSNSFFLIRTNHLAAKNIHLSAMTKQTFFPLPCQWS